ncbi:MAG: thiol:disulfide interchange protein DsbA/DsbL [Methylotetracoccus sp.]|nr:thiol:disulfide interchange protein DsbA/DsbL [Methylotetracoccus sp.]
MKAISLGTLCNVVIFFLLAVASAPRAESADEPALQAGRDYELVNPPQPTADPGKIEVLEFFWYGCPHCFHFEPDLNAWLKKKPDNVVFIRQPAIFNDRWAAHAKAYFTAESLGVIDKMHTLLYEAIQNQRLKLETEDELADFFAKHGISADDFRKAYRSFSVDSKMRQAAGMAARYGVTGTPALVVNGKYRTGGKLAKSFPQMIEVLNGLIALETPQSPPKKAAK